MSFLSGLKRLFGFGADDDYITDPETADDPDGIVSDTSSEPEKEALAPDVEGLSAVPTLPEIDPSAKARIFEGAVAVFNESLPDFLRRSVDTQKQSQLLAAAIDKGVDDYLNSLMVVAEQYAEAKLKGAADSARRDAEKLRADMQLVEQQRATLREQQLSADRRRRALADRVTDLETQLATAEAEREQFELENRSLLNKLKVADIQPGVVDEMAKELETLKAQLAAAGGEGAQPGVASDTSALEAELESLRAEKATLSAELEGARKSEAEARGKAETAARELADSRTHQEMSQAMFNDLQNSLATEREARAQAEQSLAEARKIVDSVTEIQQQMTQVEEVIRKRDERIEKLKTSNKKLREQLAEAREALDHAASADQGLFSVPASTREKVSSDSYAAIEDEFECPDWFVSEPPPGEVSPLLQPDSDFGYQEPPKKTRKPENDAQLSLF